MSIDPSICRPAIESALQANPASSILAVGENSETVFGGYLDACEDVDLTCIQADEIACYVQTPQRHDLAFVANTFERLAGDEASELIGRLRDLCTERLYVLLPMGGDWKGRVSPWRHTDMMAYGFTLAQRYELDGRLASLYVHDLYNYKQTPDWLNPNNWANPELWDKFRW